jgi:hypothetical protein
MLLYTIYPPEAIFENGDWESAVDSPGSMEELEIQRGGVHLLVHPLAGGQGQIHRIISTDPQDYLNPEWQPGSLISIQ